MSLYSGQVGKAEIQSYVNKNDSDTACGIQISYPLIPVATFTNMV